MIVGGGKVLNSGGKMGQSGEKAVESVGICRCCEGVWSGGATLENQKVKNVKFGNHPPL